MKLNVVTGDEFIRKLLAGERDFSGVALPDFNLAGHYRYNELKEYLRRQDFTNAPVKINNCYMVELFAPGVYLPGLKAEKADLRGANFREADLHGSDLRESYFRRANLAGSDLSGSNLREADLWRAYMGGANLSRANLREANLWLSYLAGSNLEETSFFGANLAEADLRGVKNLGNASNVNTAIFCATKVTPREVKILRNIVPNGVYSESYLFKIG